MRYGDNATVARRITNDEIATVAKNGRSRAAKTAVRAARGTKSIPGTLKLDGNWPVKNSKIEAFDREMAEHGRHAQGATNVMAARQAESLKAIDARLATNEHEKQLMHEMKSPSPVREPWKKTTTAALVGAGGLTVASGVAARQHLRQKTGMTKGMNRQSVMPVLARVKPNASMRRVVTGSVGKKRPLTSAEVADQARTFAARTGQKITKADVEKFSPTGAFESLTSGAKALSGGVKAGLAGVKPAAALPNMRDAKTLGLANQGAKVGGYAAANPGKVAGLVGTAGLTTGVVAGNQMSKANVAKRRFDPEDRRRHYQGVAAGVGGSAGVAALANAGRIATRDTREFKRNLPHINPGRVPGMQDERGFKTKGRARAATAQEKLGLVMDRDTRMKQWEQLNRAKMATDKVRGKKLLHIGGRSAGYGAAGLALIGTAAASHRGRNDERWD